MKVLIALCFLVMSMAAQQKPTGGYYDYGCTINVSGMKFDYSALYNPKNYVAKLGNGDSIEFNVCYTVQQPKCGKMTFAQLESKSGCTVAANHQGASGQVSYLLTNENKYRPQMTVVHPKGDGGLTFELKINCDRSVEGLKVLRAGQTIAANHYVVETASKHGCPTNKIKYNRSKPAGPHYAFNCGRYTIGGMFFDFGSLFKFGGDYVAKLDSENVINFNMCYTTNKYCKNSFGYANLWNAKVMDQCENLASGVANKQNGFVTYALTNPDKKRPQMTFSYPKSSTGKKFQLVLNCDPSQKILKVVKTTEQNNVYSVVANAAAACPIKMGYDCSPKIGKQQFDFTALVNWKKDYAGPENIKWNFCQYVDKTNQCGSRSFFTAKWNGGCDRIGGGDFQGFKITKAGPKPEITFNFNAGNSYPKRYCNGWGCEWGRKSWTSKLVVQCDPSVEGFKRTNFKQTDGDYTVWGSSKHFCPTNSAKLEVEEFLDLFHDEYDEMMNQYYY